MNEDNWLIEKHNHPIPIHFDKIDCIRYRENLYTIMISSDYHGTPIIGVAHIDPSGSVNYKGSFYTFNDMSKLVKVINDEQLTAVFDVLE